MNRRIITDIDNKSNKEWSIPALIKELKYEQIQKKKKLKEDYIKKSMAIQMKLAS